jgi:16S rRNA (cytosine967-C5)-methyltransferase
VKTARGIAVATLVAAEEGARSNVELPRLLAQSGLDERDRRLATELAYGTLRMRRACDWLIGQFARGEVEPQVKAVLRAGAYQLAFLRVPAHAAVSATVAEAPPRARGLANAVLRRVAELTEAGPPRWPDLATELSYPDWVVERLSRDLGLGPARAALEQMNRPATPTLRADGYVQDLASQAVTEHVAKLLADGGPEPAGRVLDLCAGPGGKATGLARRARLVVAVDLVPARAALVAANAWRLRLPNVAVVLADGTRNALREGTFDGVLVDAPCSGLGVLRRRPDARWRVRPDDIARLAGLQRQLLEAAAPLVRPGGLLAYSVCTMTREETTDIDGWLKESLPEWDPLGGPADPWVPLGRGALVLPQTAGTDGMYLLVLRRPAPAY